MSSTAIEKVTDEISKVIDECSLANVQGLPAMRQAIQLANGMKALRASLTLPIVESLLMPLQGTALGFRTDKDRDGGYPPEVVRDCAIEALLRGFQVVGNEFNIISGRAYFTKEGLERRVNEFQGLTELQLEPGVPHMGQGGALVSYRASWKLNGAPMSLVRDQAKDSDGVVIDQRIPIRVNAGMGADAILGKAKRKMLAHVLDRLTGARSTAFATPDGDVYEVQHHAELSAPPPPGAGEEGRRISLRKPQTPTPAREPGQDG